MCETCVRAPKTKCVNVSVCLKMDDVCDELKGCEFTFDNFQCGWILLYLCKKHEKNKKDLAFGYDEGTQAFLWVSDPELQSSCSASKPMVQTNVRLYLCMNRTNFVSIATVLKAQSGLCVCIHVCYGCHGTLSLCVM